MILDAFLMRAPRFCRILSDSITRERAGTPCVAWYRQIGYKSRFRRVEHSRAHQRIFPISKQLRIGHAMSGKLSERPFQKFSLL